MELKLRLKKNRCFDRCLSGLRRARILGKKIRFITLTTPACNGEDLSSDDKKNLIQDLFRRLYKKYHESGLIEDYFGVRTGEGNGVMHIVYVGQYIDFRDLMEDWVKLNGTCYVWITDPYKHFNSDVDVAEYFMTQYIAFQDGVDYTYGFSHNWIYQGWFKDYCVIRKCSKQNEKVLSPDGYSYYPIDYDLFYSSWNLHLNRYFSFGKGIVVQSDLGGYLDL